MFQNCNLFAATCMNVCGLNGDPSFGGRKYSTNLNESSSMFCTTQNGMMEDECKIEVHGSLRYRRVAGASQAYLKVSVTLFSDEVDD
jgi:hypothetical protein